MKRSPILSGIILLVLLTFACKSPDKIIRSGNYFAAGDPLVHYTGRVLHSGKGAVTFSFPAVTVEFAFTGPDLIINVQDMPQKGNQPDGKPTRNFLEVSIDSGKAFVLELSADESLYKIASGLSGENHTAKISKRTEALVGKIEFRGLWLAEGEKLMPVTGREHNIQFIGNSISCGYGVEADSAGDPFGCETENAMISYASLTANNLNAAYHIIAFSGRGIAQNYNKSRVNTMPVIWEQTFPDETEPAWDHSLFTPEVVVINLGTNDFNCGETDTALFRQKYHEFITRIREVHPQSLIICTTGPMLNDAYPVNSLSTIRYLLQTIVARHPADNLYFFEMSQQTGDLGYGADWHPSAAQQERNANELTAYIRSLTGW